jgi:uncharacterized membrane protein (UPF0136 family)
MNEQIILYIALGIGLLVLLVFFLRIFRKYLLVPTIFFTIGVLTYHYYPKFFKPLLESKPINNFKKL